MVLALIFLSLAVVCYSISQLQQHDKLRWGKEMQGFWGVDSWYNKYKTDPANKRYGMTPAKNNWYTRFFKIKYRERWFTSTWLTIMFTDGYHLCQAGFLLFLSLSFSIALQLQNWWQYLLVYVGIHAAHFVTYRLLQK